MEYKIIPYVPPPKYKKIHLWKIDYKYKRKTKKN